ncbi:MAG: hypothetical protein J3K34DRAFT_434586 [Monoraphidium minutum]|nr:MAG: hypothetical protein J3K34DRAFT_434586 [Monoraphidium minutum]
MARCMLNAGFLALAAVLLAMAAGAAAQEVEARQMEGFTYLYSTNLYKRQSADVIRAIDSMPWDNGLKAKGMHKCARLCKREGGGGVCTAWTFCWAERRCYLLSRLPGSLDAAQPGAISGLLGGNAYDAQCGSGFSKASANSAKLAVACDATLQANTVFGDTLSFTAPTRNRAMRESYDANQKTSADCCALCAKMKSKGCTSWSYEPYGWMLDRAHKCTLRTGVSPTITASRGATSGVMNA